jgi:hypothetical protein
MSSLRRMRIIRSTIAVVGATAFLSSAAWAAVESSCPAPCTRLPKTSLFVRETNGVLDQVGRIVPLSGMLLRGTAKTVVRIDASVFVNVNPSVDQLYVRANLNGVTSSPASYFVTCDSTKSAYCTATGTFWWDIDALEVDHPGMFVGQPLSITLHGGNLFNQGAGQPYEASFIAQVVKKK